MGFIKILPNIGFVIVVGVLVTAVNKWNTVDSSEIMIEYEPIIEEVSVDSPSVYMIVPVSKCSTLTLARVYAREALQDSASTGEKQWFLWRGGFFNTETD
tara:strand:- start:160 stop:459 length:300 start_codon:yes stop_codon:yes gene_type:complete